MKATNEQLYACEMAKTGKSFKMTAFAGAGKTSTLKMIADTLNKIGKKGIYLAFNKAIAQEAGQKMPNNVTASTVHALALSSVSPKIKQKINLKAPNIKDICQMLDIPKDTYLPHYLPIHAQDEEAVKFLDANTKDENACHFLYKMIKNPKNFDSSFYSKQVNFVFKKYNSFTYFNRYVRGIVNNFYNSGEQKITKEMVDEVFYKEAGIEPSNPSAYVKKMKRQTFEWATILHYYNINYDYNKKTKEFKLNTNTNNGVNDPHNMYLKHWQLQNPIIHTDFILYDEAQDASGVMLAILEQQMKHGTQVIFVGDPHQQIYAWRGAVNAMKQLDIDESFLTQSFRFGNEIAKFADLSLKIQGEKRTLTSGRPDIKDKVHFLPRCHHLIENDDDEKAIVLDKKQWFAWFKTHIEKNKDNKHALVCRSNSFAFEASMELNEIGIKHFLDVNTKELSDIFFTIHDFMSQDLKGKPKEKKQFPNLFAFRCIENEDDFKKHLAENENDQELTQYVNMYNRYGIEKLASALSQKNDDTNMHICTMHKSKGLEWDNVIIAPDIFNFMLRPLTNLLDDEKQAFGTFNGEQYRLFYVAITRAKKNLYINRDFQFLLEMILNVYNLQKTSGILTNQNKKEIYTKIFNFFDNI